MDNNIIEIYTDGACKGNPGPGGWGAILNWQDITKEISGAEANTTNNRMELTAAIEAIKIIKKRAKIKIYTDSNYLKNGITGWINKWKLNNWNNNKIKNIDLWQKLDTLSQQHDIEWLWVKGHSGNILNERVDKLACESIKKLFRK